MFYNQFLKKYLSNIIAWLIIATILSGYAFVDYKTKTNLDYNYHKTKEYLKIASWSYYQAKAEQWQTPEKISEKSKYGASVIPVDEPQKDAVDFQLIHQIEQELDGISHKVVLQKLFREITNPFMAEEKKWQNILIALNESIFHHYYQQPLYEDGSIISDPLLLLELGNGRCGHMARILADIALANGYEARLVQVAHHVTAEVKWSNKWHLADPLLINQDLDNWNWPSIEDLSKNQNYINTFPPPLWDYTFGDKFAMADPYFPPFYNTTVFFDKDGAKISYWRKIGKNWQDNYYGWSSLNTEEANLATSVNKQMPSMGSSNIEQQENKIKIHITDSKDIDNDFWHFELYLSNVSRGWTYQNKEDYKKLFNPIPDNLGRYAFGQELELDLPPPGKYYMTYFAKDNYAKENPQAFYFPSEEIQFEVK